MSDHHDLPAGHYHHFEPEQAYSASKLGMWIFLATEVHLFGGLFCTFAVFRWRYLEEFNEHAKHLNWVLGGLNTLILLASSYFMVRAVDAAQKGLNRRVVNWLDATLIAACAFMVVKYQEWMSKFDAGIYPDSHVFWGLYFVMTGLHAVHVLVGMGAIVWLRRLASKDKFKVTYYTPVEVVGLYWHLVDVVWIYLFPLLYLMAGIEVAGGAH